MPVLPGHTVYTCPCCGNGDADNFYHVELVTMSPPTQEDNSKTARESTRKPKQRVCRECGYNIDAAQEDPQNMKAAQKVAMTRGLIEGTSHIQEFAEKEIANRKKIDDATLGSLQDALKSFDLLVAGVKDIKDSVAALTLRVEELETKPDLKAEVQGEIATLRASVSEIHAVTQKLAAKAVAADKTGK